MNFVLIFNRIDYCGVIILIMTSYIPWLHFAFYCQRYIKLSYMVLVTVLGLACISVVVRDEFREPCYRWLRLGKLYLLANQIHYNVCLNCINLSHN